MLKVRIYLDPSDGGKTRQIAHANIINTGMGDEAHGDYYAHFYRENKLVRSSHIGNWLRLENGPWELLGAALRFGDGGELGPVHPQSRPCARAEQADGEEAPVVLD